MAEQDGKTITVLFFGFTRDMAGTRSMELTLQRPAQLAQVQQQIYQRFPAIAAQADSIRWAVNCDYSDAETTVPAGAEVALIPPVAGG